jgi:glycosyltransferase involved in cell wall biosynthesis
MGYYHTEIPEIFLRTDRRKLGMKRIALVNQRYGAEVNGGSEYYTRLIAERLAGSYRVDVITTKALDYTTWADYYPADEEELNGVHIRRFSVARTRAKDFNEYNGDYLRRIGEGKPDTEREAVWFEKQGPFCPAAIDYIRTHRDDYDVFIFVTYLYYLTVKGLPEVADKAILIPTAHEEPFIHFKTYETLFRLPKRYIFLTDEERELVQGLFGTQDIPCGVMGTGVEIPEQTDAERFRKKYGITDEYLIYVGRIDEGKDCPMLFRYFLEYKSRHPENTLKLVLMGKPVCAIPKHGDILSLGFVSEEDKFDGISGARALVLPSKFESLSISVLEAMSLSVPVIVNGICDVLRGHCVKSNGGLYYHSFFEFEGIVDYLLSHTEEYAQMCRNARLYIDRYYTWDSIMAQFREKIEEVIG